MARAGDVNGDGFADIAVTAYFAPGTLGAPGPGQVYVYTGGLGGLSAAPFARLDGGRARDTFGAAIACAGDLDGDGLSDLAVGASEAPYDSTTDTPRPGGGRVYVYPGARLAGTPSAAITLSPSHPGSFGIALAGMGDLDGDGLAELAIGAPTSTPDDGDAEIGMGRVSVYCGVAGASLVRGCAERESLGGPADEFGSALANAGDLDGDGFADLVIGAWAAQRVDVFAGSAAGLGPAPTRSLRGPVTGEAFGSSLAR